MKTLHEATRRPAPQRITIIGAGNNNARANTLYEQYIRLMQNGTATTNTIYWNNTTITTARR